MAALTSEHGHPVTKPFHNRGLFIARRARNQISPNVFHAIRQTNRETGNVPNLSHLTSDLTRPFVSRLHS